MDRNAKPDTHRSEQGVLNRSFDETYQVLAVEQLAYNVSAQTLDRVKTATIQTAVISASSVGDNQIVAGVTNKKIKVLSAVLVANGTVSIKWRSNTTDKSGAMPLVANSGFVLPASSPSQGHYIETNTSEALNISLSGAVGVYGHITYYTE